MRTSEILWTFRGKTESRVRLLAFVTDIAPLQCNRIKFAIEMHLADLDGEGSLDVAIGIRDRDGVRRVSALPKP